MTVTLITGANKGLGFEMARRLLALGHTVYLGARDRERGEAAAHQLGAHFVPVLSQISIAAESRSVSRVEVEHATEPFASADTSGGRGRIAGGEGDDVAQALVVSLGVVVVHELAHDVAQMPLAEGNDVPEALVLDRPNKPLGIGV
jgi:NAD(P)-dependent dehydrogenase (short-subunit alcohol dehydrogenase family)